MKQNVRITVLVENTAEDAGLLAEHGLAFWIDAGSQRILFDTGQGGVLLANAYRLGIDLSRLDAVVLSHGHYDHTGGLADALRGNRPGAIYAHPDALKPKFARNKDGTSRPIGMPDAAQRAVERHRDRLVLTDTHDPHFEQLLHSLRARVAAAWHNPDIALIPLVEAGRTPDWVKAERPQ